MSMGNTDNISNEQIYELLQRTSQDILLIRQDVASYKKEIDNLKNTVETLEAENDNLKQKLSFHEDLLKKKNILIFGLLELENKSLEEILIHFFRDKLQINIQIGDLDIFYRIGKKKNGEHTSRPILVKFLREITVQRVFKSVYKLKGTGVSVSRDETREKRADNKILYEYLKIAKEKEFPAKIYKSKLFIGNDEYTAEHLRNVSKGAFLEPYVDKSTLFPNTSAPPTPTVVNEQINSSSEDEIFQIPDKELDGKLTDIKKTSKETGEALKEKNIEQKPKLKITRSKIIHTQTPTGRKTRTNSTNRK